MIRAPVSSSDYQAAAELRSALRRFLRRSEEIARRHALTPRQYLLLLTIKAREEWHPRAVDGCDIVVERNRQGDGAASNIRAAMYRRAVLRPVPPIRGVVTHSNHPR